MEHRSAQAKQELILQEFLEKHHFDPPAAILPQLRIVTQKERDTLLKKGDPIHAVYIILEGQYTVSEAWSNGAIFIFTELGPGDFICEMECYQGAQAVQYNLICKSDSLLLAVPVEGFLAWQAVDPGLCQMLIQSLIRKLGSSARTASQMPIASGIVKFARFLIGYCRENGIDSRQEVSVRMTREDLSYNLGLSVRTINRLVQSLRERNALTVRSGKIHITADQLPCCGASCLIPIRPDRRQITHFDIIPDLFLAKRTSVLLI